MVKSGERVLAGIEYATLYPQRRDVMLESTVERICRRLPARGTAILLPETDGIEPWRVWCAGEGGLRSWVYSRLHDSPGDTVAALSERCPLLNGTKPVVFPLGEGGLWVIWPGAEAGMDESLVWGLRCTLETLVEVERLEKSYFSKPGAPLAPELTQALKRGDAEALPELLDLTRIIGSGDLSYWGSVRHGIVDVEWSAGALDAGFGFELPLGEGVGGRAFAGERELEIPDYRNCQYRYPVVSDITDSEKVRSTLAVPVHGPDAASGAVLYVARRKVSPFSPAERAVLLRLGRSLEPVGKVKPDHGGNSIGESRSSLRRLMLHANTIVELEEWVERFTRGPAMVVDGAGLPYVRANLDRLESLNEAPQIVPFEDHGGSLWMWPTVELPPRGWADFLEDLSAATTVVTGRVEHAHQKIGEQRSRWLRDMLESGTSSSLRREGNHLGLPVDNGELWAIAWGREEPVGLRLRMMVEEAALDYLGSPLIFIEGELGVILPKNGVRLDPPSFRDELLKHFAPAPLWLVHGACYRSFEEMGEKLRRITQAAERAREEEFEKYILRVRDHGLASLIHRPGVSGALAAFAADLLAPLLEYDRRTGSDLTHTFCCALALGSYEKAARSLFVHPNTVRYRVGRATEILERDLAIPQEKTALSLAAFVWLGDQDISKLPAR